MNVRSTDTAGAEASKAIRRDRASEIRKRPVTAAFRGAGAIGYRVCSGCFG